MQASVLHKDLEKLLSFTSRFVSNRAQLPILANIKLVAKGAKLTLEATNLEMSVSGSIGAKVEKEGEVAVPSRAFTDLVSSLHVEKLLLESQGESLQVSGENFKSNLSGMNTSDFPEIPNSLNAEFAIPQEIFSKAVSQVLFSCSPELSRPALGGVLMLFSDNNLSLVTSDGFRLSRRDLVLKSKLNKKIIVPKNILTELVRISSDEKEISFFSGEENKQVLFGAGDMVFGSRMVEGEYPPFEKIIPTTSSTTVNVNKEDFRSAIKTAAVFAREGANTVKLHLEDNVVEVSAQSAQTGSQESVVEAKIEGPALDIIFNYRYLEDFLNITKGESVTMKFNSATAAGVFLDSDDENYLHLVMPVKS